MASSSSPPASQLPPIEWGTTALPSDAIETTIALAQRELFVYWSCTRFKPLPLNAAGQVQKRALRLLNDQLISPEPALGEGAQHETPRLHFTRLMLQALGLCVRANHHLRAAGGYLTPPAFWSRSALSRTRTCLEAWLRLPEWSELSTLGMATFDLDLAQARRLLLGHLCQLQSGTWLSAERFLERVSVLAPRLIFQKEDKYPGIPYFKDANYLTQQARWVAEVEAAFVGGVSAAGGVGTITGSIIGALVMMSLTSGMNLMNIDISVQYIVRGAVLVLAVIFDRITRRKK